MTTALADRFTAIQTQIGSLSRQINYPSPTLLAVSKTRSIDDINALYQLGQRHFGENYLNEALSKIETLKALDITWHFIGPIQSNKTRPIAHHFHWVHSVARLKVAKRLNDQRPEGMAPLNICLQVNIDNEPSKSGLPVEDVPATAAKILQLPNLKLRGLMCIPQKSDNTQQQRQPFQKLAVLLQQLKQEQPTLTLDTLSMGMSNDLEAAIQEGATLVRIGTALFGPRST